MYVGVICSRWEEAWFDVVRRHAEYATAVVGVKKGPEAAAVVDRRTRKEQPLHRPRNIESDAFPSLDSLLVSIAFVADCRSDGAIHSQALATKRRFGYFRSPKAELVVETLTRRATTAEKTTMVQSSISHSTFIGTSDGLILRYGIFPRSGTKPVPGKFSWQSCRFSEGLEAKPSCLRALPSEKAESG